MTTNQPTISIITPVFNGAEFIEETILSILNCQTQVKFEYIIINDGSTDSTLEIISKYSQGIRVVNQENAGEAEAVNAGFRISRGKYCLVVSADDPLLSGKLLDISIHIMELQPEIVATYVDWQVINNKGEVIRKKVLKNYSRMELIGRFNCLPGPGACFRTQAALQIGGRSANFKYVSDYDFWLRLSTQGNFHRIPQMLAQWRVHPNSTTVSQQGKLMAQERVKVIEKFLAEFPTEEKIARSAKAHSNYFAARVSIDSPGIPARRYMLNVFSSHLNVGVAKFSLLTIYVLFLPFSYRTLVVSRQIFSKIKKLFNNEK
jgi:glycosyltransferase involved in cell wall biosynthesis